MWTLSFWNDNTTRNFYYNRSYNILSMKIDYKFWITFLVLLGISLLFLLSDAHASTIKLISSTQYAQKGQEFEVTALIIPERSNYTTSLRMCFQNAEFVSFYQSLEWLQLRVPKYWEVNNGIIARTAGFPGGFNTTTVFGKFIFKATETGFINVTTEPSSLILGADNKNLYEM